MSASAINSDQATAITAIQTVIHRYAFLARENADVSAIVDLFAPEGVFVLPDGNSVPAAAMAAIVGDRPPKFIRHHVTTSVVDLKGDTTAESTTYFVAYTDLANPDHWGYWNDAFRKNEDGSWVLTSKQPVVEGFVRDGEWAKMPWNAS